MACPDEETLLRYLQSADGVDTTVEDHVDGCATCRHVIAVLAQSSALLGDASASPVAGWASDVLPAGVCIGRYVVRGHLGSGAMGVVYDAMDPELQRSVAIKRIRAAAADDPDRQARLLREARSLARLSHPNVVPVYDAGIHGGHAFIAMELVHGTTLRAWLAARPRTPAAILDAMRQVGSGLVAVHAAGLVHRDFKPDNALVAADDRVMVTDFGLVTLGRTAAASTDADVGITHDMRLTRTGELVGTPRYMAPEQLVGAAVGPAADQFAFCVVVFEALTGRHPFAGDTPEALLAAIRSRAIDPACSRLPRRLRALLRRGLDPDPERRYASLREVVDRLELRSGVLRPVWIAAACVPCALWFAIAAADGPTPVAVVDATPPATAPAPSTALLDEGRRDAESGAFASARQALERAHAEAMAAGASAIEADAAIELVRVIGIQGEDRDGGRLWQRHAEAALERLGDDPDRRARLLDASGGVSIAAGEFDVGRQQYADALALCRARYGPDDPRTAVAQSHVAIADAKLGAVESAIRDHVAALSRLDPVANRVERASALLALASAETTLRERTLARRNLEEARDLLDERDGPLLGRVANNLAITMTSQGDLAAAKAELDRAELLLTQAYGADHPNLAGVLVGRGNLLAVAGELLAAREVFERALAIKERAFGLEHPSLQPIVENLAQIARLTGDRPGALRHYRRAVDLAEAHLGPTHLDLAMALEDLGHMLAVGDDPSEAIAVLDRAYAIHRVHVGEDDPSLCNYWLARGQVHIATQEWVAADRELGRALVLASTSDQRAAIEISRAESLWRRGDHRDAVRAARRARQAALDSPGHQDQLANVDDWLAKH